MNINITPRYERFIAEKIKSGVYATPEEVVREGLRRLEAEDERHERVEWLRAEIERGFVGPSSPWSSKDVDRVRNLIASQGQR